MKTVKIDLKLANGLALKELGNVAQQELGDRLNLSNGAISKIVRGHTSLTIEVKERFLEEFNIPLSTFDQKVAEYYGKEITVL